MATLVSTSRERDKGNHKGCPYAPDANQTVDASSAVCWRTENIRSEKWSKTADISPLSVVESWERRRRSCVLAASH